MKLLILGATGGTGLEIISAALRRGHTVTALVRSAERLEPFRDRITVERGDLLNSTELADAIQGQDAVLSGFGPRLPTPKADVHLWQRFAIALTEGMQRTTVKRVVVTSTSLLFRDSIIPPTRLVGRLFFPTTVADATAMEHAIVESGLSWTIVRPPQLTNKPFTGKYRTRLGHLPVFGFTISRADLADCMVKAVADDTLIHGVIGISN